MDILSDHVWEDAQGHKFGAFVFARGGLLAGLDLYSVDGSHPYLAPKARAASSFTLSHTRDLTELARSNRSPSSAGREKFVIAGTRSPARETRAQP
jgi:hypothetical protein